MKIRNDIDKSSSQLFGRPMFVVTELSRNDYERIERQWYGWYAKIWTCRMSNIQQKSIRKQRKTSVECRYYSSTWMTLFDIFRAILNDVHHFRNKYNQFQKSLGHLYIGVNVICAYPQLSTNECRRPPPSPFQRWDWRVNINSHHLTTLNTGQGMELPEHFS